MKTKGGNADPNPKGNKDKDKKGSDKDIKQYVQKNNELNSKEQTKITNASAAGAAKSNDIDAKLNEKIKKEENKEREQYEKNKNNPDIADATEGHGYGSIDDYL